MTTNLRPPAQAPHKKALLQLVEEARVLVRSCTGAAITVISGLPAQIVGTSLLATRLDQAQWASGQGPGLDAVHQLQVFNVADLGAARSWPEFTGLALGRGVASCLAVPIIWRGRALGALNLYSESADGFAGQERLGLQLAADAAVALSAFCDDSAGQQVPAADPRPESAVS
jgi:GAF domain-containing protein